MEDSFISEQMTDFENELVINENVDMYTIETDIKLNSVKNVDNPFTREVDLEQSAVSIHIPSCTDSTEVENLVGLLEKPLADRLAENVTISEKNELISDYSRLIFEDEDQNDADSPNFDTTSLTANEGVDDGAEIVESSAETSEILDITLPSSCNRENYTCSREQNYSLNEKSLTIDTEDEMTVEDTEIEMKTNALIADRELEVTERKTEALVTDRELEITERKTEALVIDRELEVSEMKTDSLVADRELEATEMKTDALVADRELEATEMKTDALVADRGLEVIEMATDAVIDDVKMVVAEPRDDCKEDNPWRNQNMEEGELEEGELFEDEEEEPAEEGSKEEKEENEMEQNKENRAITKKNKKTNKSDKESVLEQKKGEVKKRKHEEEEDKKNKRNKKSHLEGEDEKSTLRKKEVEKASDFDRLLKRQMYLVGTGPYPPPDCPFAGGNSLDEPHVPYLGDSYDSASAEEWEGKEVHRRLQRKRRGSRSPSRKNEALCMFYLQGSCKRGLDCPYSHNITPTRKMELCKFYMMDCCAKKEKCLYMHMDFPCKYFHFGIKCKDGELCKFSHDPMIDLLKNILVKHIEMAPKDILGDFPRLSKHSAQTIITITEAKRKGEPVSEDFLKEVAEFEGKGFRYLDRALKSVRKKKGPDEGKAKNENTEAEKSAKEKERVTRLKEGKDNEKEEKGEKEGPKERKTDKEKEKRSPSKLRNRDESRGRNSREAASRDSDRRRTRRSRGRPREGGGSGVRRGRGGNAREIPPKPRMEDHDTRISGNGRTGRVGGDANPHTRWYSSDEDPDCNQKGLDGKRDSFAFSSGSRRMRNRVTHGPQEENPPSGNNPPFLFSTQSNLPNIDFSYLKNVLSTVRNQISQKQGVNMNDSWDSASYSRESTSNQYQDTVADDIKEVFGEPSEQLKAFSKNLDDFIHKARGPPHRHRSGSSQEHRDKSSHRENQTLDPNRNMSETRTRDKDDNDWNITDDPRRRSKGVMHHNTRNHYIRDEENCEVSGSFSVNLYSKTQHDYNSDSERLRDPLGREDISPPYEGNKLSRGRLSEDRPSILIYEIGEPPPSSEYSDELSDLPFKVPLHSAKEIDASLNAHMPIYYQLISITIPKPDYSRLKINRDDPRCSDDPRLRVMLRRSSTEKRGLSSPDSPPCAAVVTPNSPPLDPRSKLMSKLADFESRDPRKMPNRDPRTQLKSDSGKSELWPDIRNDHLPDPRCDYSRSDPHPDPRIDLRQDPRMDPRYDPRQDPRLDSRSDPANESHSDFRLNLSLDQRADRRLGSNSEAWLDPRGDPRLGLRNNQRSDPSDADLRIGRPIFANGLMEGNSFGPFSTLGNIASAIIPGIDPRGRPGLLGPGPSPNGLPLGQGINPPAFLLQQGMGGATFMPRDRGEMMGVPNFPQGQPQGWGVGGRPPFNDPRMN